MKKLYLLLGLLMSAGLTRAQTCGTIISTFPHTQDFESVPAGTGALPTGWSVSVGQVNSLYLWKINAGSTPAIGTGPNVDHTLGTAAGKYAYTDALSGSDGSSTDLISPCINLTGLTNPGFDYWYHMAGLGMGRLDVQVSKDNGATWTTVQSYSGQQQTAETDPWRKKTINLGAYANQTVKIKFKGTKLPPPPGSSNLLGDMAIDDVKLYSLSSSSFVDLSMTAIAAPISGCGFGTAETITVAITNNGTVPTSSFQVSYQIGTSTPVQETANLVIAPGATGTYSFTTKANLSTVGTYAISTSVTALNDVDVADNTTSKSLIVLPAISTFPYFEDFEASNGGWVSGGTNSSWVWGPPNGIKIVSAASGSKCWSTNPGYYYKNDENSYVLGPCFNLSSLTVPVISMKINWHSETHMDGAVLQASTDGGATWQRVGNFGDLDNWYNDSTITGTPGGQKKGWSGRLADNASSNGWLLARHKLDGLGGKSSVQLRIAFGSNFGVYDEGFAFDDVRIFEAPANELELVAITAPATRSCGFTAAETVTLTIKNNGLAATTSFPVSYQIGSNPAVQETANLVIAPGATATYSFTTKANLSAFGSYVFTAKTLIPGDSDPTNDIQIKTVNAVPEITTYPYSQDFEAGTGGWVSGGTNSSWAWGTPTKPVINAAASGTKVWTTSLAGKYNAQEQSYVVGPCFNLSAVASPVVSLKIWWSSDALRDGAVLQSSIDGGVTWQRVGNVGDPDNWYNKSSLNGSPGVGPLNNPQPGWGGRASSSDGSNGWVLAKHALTGLGGKPSVLLRIAWGTGLNSLQDGFAFDDFSISDASASDIELVAITAPKTGTCGLTASETVTITIKNNGAAAISNFPVSYQIGTNAAVQETTNLTIAPGATATYTFTAKANMATTGGYAFTAKTLLPGDGLPANDTQSKTIVNSPTISTFPYSEDFENGDGNWMNTGTNSSWKLGTPAKLTLTTAASGTKAWITNLSGNYNGSENSAVVSPCFNFSALSAPTILMKIWWNTEDDRDGAVLQSSIDGGATWQKVGTFGNPDNWYNTHSVKNTPGGVTADSSGWCGHTAYGNGSKTWLLAKHALTGLGGKSSVKLRIAFASDASGHFEGVAFDDVRIIEATGNDLELVSLTAPAASSGCGFTATETVCIEIKNNGTVATTSFPVKYQIGSNPPVQETANIVIAPGTTYSYCFNATVNLATPGNYTISASTLMPGDADPINDTKSKTVNVLPSISTFPYTEGFENGAGGWTSGGTSSSWALGTPAKPIINSAAAGTQAWVTNLTGNYNSYEKSFVEGPCFSFANVADPFFEMKAWWNSETGFDGAVLESSIDGGTTWKKVGTVGTGTNWYNIPGYENWSGALSTQNGSNGWVKVRHALTGLGGELNVKLRIAFTSIGIGSNDEGFAFDEIRIGDNTKNLAVNSIVPISKTCGFSATEKITTVLENLSNAPVTGFTVSYTVNQGAPVTQTYTASLAPATPTNFTFSQPANLSAAGPYTIVVTVNMSGDTDASNNSSTYTLSNSSFTGLPPVFDFETTATGIASFNMITKPLSTIFEDTAASSGKGSTKGMIMDGVDKVTWQVPTSAGDAWTTNMDNFSVAYFCFNPPAASCDSLLLTFNLKQLSNGISANTNFRVTVNGTQVGPTYRPSFAGGKAVWQKIKVDLTSFKTLSGLQIGFESNVKEAYANGAGTANLIDNINIYCAQGATKPNGVKSDLLANQLSVFPNPSNGQFNVSLPQGKSYKLEVTDLTGKVLKRQTANGDVQINLEGTAKGIYLLKVSGESGSTVRKLIVE